MFSLDPYANSDFEATPMLAKVSTRDQAWARGQVSMKVPLLCLVPQVLLQVLALQSEQLM
jgi:hypothetical protein